MQRFAYGTIFSTMILAAATLGCIEQSTDSPIPPGSAQPTTDAHDHGDHAHDHHDHAAHGPHGGHLLELGGGQYHAEWTHDDLADQENAKQVTVYILGEDAKTETPIAAESITINVSGGKEPMQYELKAVNAQDGKASQFSIEDPALIVALGMAGEGVEARLNVNIDGTPYNAAIEHDHHDDHAHDHGHEGHEH